MCCSDKKFGCKASYADTFIFSVLVLAILNISISAGILVNITSLLYSVMLRITFIISIIIWMVTIREDILNMLVAVMIIWQLIIVLIYEAVSFDSFYHICTWPCVFASSYSLARRGKIKQNVVAYIIITLIVSTLLVYNYRNGSKNDIYYVYYSLLLLPFILETKKKALKIFLEIWIASIIVYSYKRTGMVLLVIGITTYYLTDMLETKGKKERVKKIAIIILASILVCYTISNYASDWVVFRRFQRLSQDGGSGRIELWNACIQYIQTEPMINLVIGNGYKGVDKIIPKYAGAHNDFLEIIIDYGIIGVINLLLFLIYVCKKILLAFKIRYKKIAPLISEASMCMALSFSSFLLWQSFLSTIAALYIGYKIGDIQKTYESYIENKGITSEM